MYSITVCGLAKKKGGGERAPTVTEGGMAGVVTAEEC